jgi:hypothetical protein
MPISATIIIFTICVVVVIGICMVGIGYCLILASYHPEAMDKKADSKE